MSEVQPSDLVHYCQGVGRAARAAATRLTGISGGVRNRWLRTSADLLCGQAERILAANAQDLQQAPNFGLAAAQIDRLRLSVERVEEIAQGLREVADLPDPVGETIESVRRPNGMEVSRIRVPLGVVFFVYESRPNVTADAAAICIKSGNAVILRGGKEAAHSSRAIVEILQSNAKACGLPADAVQLVSHQDREAVGHFLRLAEYIDVAIPRGGEGLIRRVAEEARMPVIKHFAGNCHVYVDRAAEEEMAVAITLNSKCQRLGTCNTCESLLIHSAIAADLLPVLVTALQAEGVEVRGDPQTVDLIPQVAVASEEDHFAEYLGPVISVRVVASLEDAIETINHYGSGHTDAIVTNDLASARRFAEAVDSSAVMINASTRFNDGGQFGLGAEIGISTDKFHARGPCGLRELTSYKYVVYGDGHTRE
ncbi:MAG: glutamate-5-semialdehyde dehydrogenase [Planctomycetaceae bacterium]|nr:glutamate-5-semialdehyde dehydrogenase [Planctomycetaceae bacterium]